MAGEETLGDRIRKLRHEKGLSLAKVAKDDFSRAFLNQVELGKAQPSTRVLRVIASRLGARVDYLLDGVMPSLDKEIAVERGRLSVALGNHKQALAELEPAVDSGEYPLGTDARLTQAAALLGLGRRDEALAVLAAEEQRIRGRNDDFRLRRLLAIRRGAPFSASANTHRRLAGEALEDGRHSDALEHLREARILTESARAIAPKEPAPKR